MENREIRPVFSRCVSMPASGCFSITLQFSAFKIAILNKTLVRFSLSSFFILFSILISHVKCENNGKCSCLVFTLQRKREKSTWSNKEMWQSVSVSFFNFKSNGWKKHKRDTTIAMKINCCSNWIWCELNHENWILYISSSEKLNNTLELVVSKENATRFIYAVEHTRTHKLTKCV